MIEQPVGIIKTLPIEFFLNYEDGGRKGFEKDFEMINKRADQYHMVFNLNGKPKYEVLYFYLNYDGAIRYRGNILGYAYPNASIVCLDGKTVFGKIWVEVGPPIIKLKPVPMKGFQSFRYTNEIYP